jgi:glycosyltransferase involved in cell wall biosynthesis
VNILYLCDEYPPGRHGGIGTLVQLLARQMVKTGHKVIVAGLYMPGYGEADEFEDEGVKVYRFRGMFDGRWFQNQDALPVRIINKILKLSGLMQWGIKRSLAAYREKLEQIITENKIDIIEMPDYNDYVRFCLSYVPFPKLSVPVVVKLNGSNTYFAREAGKQVPAHILQMEQDILKQATAVSSASQYTAIKTAEYLSYHNKIEVLYNGIDTNIPQKEITRNPKQVIFTGSLVQKKGIYQLAKAWNIVNKTMPNARLIIAGKGPQQKVKALLSKEAITSVSFTGHVDKEGLYNHLFASAISVFPSYAEAFALAPLEAMACGTAVINTNRASGPELINDKINGLLINPDDINQIAEAILFLLQNPEACQTIAQKGNEKVRELFDIAKIAEENLKFYSSVIESKSKSQ